MRGKVYGFSRAQRACAHRSVRCEMCGLTGGGVLCVRVVGVMRGACECRQ